MTEWRGIIVPCDSGFTSPVAVVCASSGNCLLVFVCIRPRNCNVCLLHVLHQAVPSECCVAFSYLPPSHKKCIVKSHWLSFLSGHHPIPRGAWNTLVQDFTLKMPTMSLQSGSRGGGPNSNIKG